METRGQRSQRRRLLLGLGLIAGLGLATPGLALEPQRLLSQYNHEVWRSENGLPQNSILAAAQTSDGYLWFGTYEGLARFDGARFTVFDRKNSPEMGESTTFALVEDAAGVLWVGTRQGLLRMEDGQLRRPMEVEELAEIPVKHLAADGKSVWISTHLGLVRAPVSGKGPWRWFKPKDGLPSVGGVGPVVVDGAGGAWVGTAKGVAHVSGDAVRMFAPPTGEAGDVQALALARDGTLWIGTSRGLLSLREGRFTRYGPEQGMPEGFVRALLEDRDGNLWLATPGGLLRRNAAGFRAATYPQSLADARVNCLLEDKDGHLWVGTQNEGLQRLSNGPFLPFGPPEGSTLDGVYHVLEARDGSLWLSGLNGGLERVKNGVTTRLVPEPKVEHARPRALAEDQDGTIWVGMGTGAYRYDGQRFVRLGPEQGMPESAGVWAMAPEPGGGMWFTTTVGLARLRDGRVTLYGQELGFFPDHIMTMLRDDSGTIWIGTNQGLARFERGIFTRFTTRDGLVGDLVHALYADSHGTLWMGTNTGLSRLKEGRFSNVNATHGLPDETIFTLLVDSDDFFWMSSNKGVSRVSRRELEEVADGRRERVSGVLYDERDGMRAGECNGGAQPAGWKTRDGRMWFANLRGAVMVDPKDVRLRHRAPQLRIEELRVQGKPVPVTERLVLEPGQRDVDIRFTAFVAEGAARLPLRYRLEGHDSGWVDADGRRVARYTRLPPGDYRFEVTALGRDGRWVEPGAVVEVVMRPWFYQTGWFYALCALGVGGLAGGSYVWRVGRLKARERWLRARVDERTRELARANEELDANLRALRATQAQLVQAGKMAAVGTLAAGVGHEINNPLSYIVSNLEHAHEEAGALVRLEGAEQSRERLREMQQVLREALTGADRVRRIVRDLKTFSRQDEDLRGPVDLRVVMDSAAKMAAGELKPRAQLFREYAADVPPVEGNEARLAQVFLNLIINAAQALPEGRPEQHEVRLVLKRGGAGEVVAEVRDSGCGIPPEVLGRIFDPFFTTKPVGEGTGLGLALCQAFVAAMAGRIEVESQVGKGTVVRVTLPTASGPVQRVSRGGSDREPGVVRGRVLIVDDDPLVSAALRRTLAREHEVEVVVSSRRALELLLSREGDYDVILCDLMMPEMTGMELHAQLEAEKPEQAQRMVFITGGAYTPTAKAFLERVSHPRVEKPFEPEQLREQVRECVAKARSSLTGQAA
jgi:ligand-binding sensor domain-containing protein/signal transduction histidine kinase/CheY-like chemotaxis protein